VKNEKELSVQISAKLPRGDYHLLAVGRTGQRQILPNALKLQIAPRERKTSRWQLSTNAEDPPQSPRGIVDRSALITLKNEYIVNGLDDVLEHVLPDSSQSCFFHLVRKYIKV